MSMNYQQFVLRLAQNIGPLGDGMSWPTAVGETIDYAEQRIYRELQLLSTMVRDTSGSCTANSRNFTLPTSLGRFVVVDGINVVTPVGSTVTNGTRNVVTPASRDYIDFCWQSNTAPSATTVPTNFAMITDQTVIFGPAPGAAFQVEVIGTIRPTPLSASNSTTYLTLYLPDLFLAAAMVHIYGTQGGTSAPQVGEWEQQYQMLKGSADMEENRKRFAGASWTSKQVEPSAVPQRG